MYTFSPALPANTKICHRQAEKTVFAIHWALGLGAEVYVTSGSEEKINKVKSLGVSEGVSYRDEGFTVQLRAMSGGFDAIIV